MVRPTSTKLATKGAGCRAVRRAWTPARRACRPGRRCAARHAEGNARAQADQQADSGRDREGFDLFGIERQHVRHGGGPGAAPAEGDRQPDHTPGRARRCKARPCRDTIRPHDARGCAMDVGPPRGAAWRSTDETLLVEDDPALAEGIARNSCAARATRSRWKATACVQTARCRTTATTSSCSTRRPARARRLRAGASHPQARPAHAGDRDHRRDAPRRPHLRARPRRRRLPGEALRARRAQRMRAIAATRVAPGARLAFGALALDLDAAALAEPDGAPG